MPKGGLEPPHPCEYMDLNHARLPIPPLRHGVIRASPTGPKHANRESLVLQTGGSLSIPEGLGQVHETPRLAYMRDLCKKKESTV